MADAQTLFTHYRQVKNPNPVFTPPEGSITHPFCQKLMKRAHGYTESIDFDVRYLFSRLAIECGRVTKSSSEVLSKRKAIKALYSLEKDLGFIVYLRDKSDGEASIRLTSTLGIFPLALSEAKLGSSYLGGAVL